MFSACMLEGESETVYIDGKPVQVILLEASDSLGEQAWTEQDVSDVLKAFQDRGLPLRYAGYAPTPLAPKSNLIRHSGYEQFVIANFRRLRGDYVLENNVDSIANLLPLKRTPQTNVGSIVGGLRISFDPKKSAKLSEAAELYRRITPKLQTALDETDGLYLGDALPLNVERAPEIDYKQQKRASVALFSVGMQALLDGNQPEALRIMGQLQKLADITHLPPTVINTTIRLYVMRFWCAMALTGIDRQLWSAPELQEIIKQCQSINHLEDYERSIALELARVLAAYEQTPEAKENIVYLYENLGIIDIDKLPPEVMGNYDFISALHPNYSELQKQGCIYWHGRVLDCLDASNQRFYPDRLQRFEDEFEGAISNLGGASVLAGMILPDYGYVLRNAGDWQSIVILIEAMAYAQWKDKHENAAEATGLEAPTFKDTLGQRIDITKSANGKFQVKIRP